MRKFDVIAYNTEYMDIHNASPRGMENEALIIYQDEGDGEWYVFTKVENVNTARMIAESLNKTYNQ